MGDVIKAYSVRSTAGEKAREARLYFDTGSSWTFVKSGTAEGLKGVFRLPAPVPFRGLGNGVFHATHAAQLEVRMAGIWVPHLCYVVPDNVLEPSYDVLLGHDFMQRYDVHLESKRRRVLVDKERLRMALRVRSETSGRGIRGSKTPGFATAELTTSRNVSGSGDAV
jgi:hypothetical protein